LGEQLEGIYWKLNDLEAKAGRALWLKAAQRVSGRKDLRIIWQRPEKGLGKFDTDGRGLQPTMWLDPTLTKTKQFRVFLHELGHAKDPLFYRPKALTNRLPEAERIYVTKRVMAQAEREAVYQAGRIEVSIPKSCKTIEEKLIWLATKYHD